MLALHIRKDPVISSFTLLSLKPTCYAHKTRPALKLVGQHGH